MKIKLLTTLLVMIMGGTTLSAEIPNTSHIIDPKIASSKKSIDEGLVKMTKYAEEGDAGKFPRKCAFTSTRLIKYTFPDAPKEIHDYYDHAKHLCYGKIHTQALHTKLRKEGKSICKQMETTLQINHITKHIKKTNDMPIWDKFMLEYKETCPNNLNF
jgi:hypothetical protein